MHFTLHIFHYTITGYAVFVLLGIVVPVLIATVIMRRHKLSGDDFILLGVYALVGAFLGSKLLYLLVSARQIAWDRFFEPEVFSIYMRGGFVFYGGLLGAMLTLPLGARIHKIDLDAYLDRLVFLIPLGHAFGRVGCYCAGCCYGVEYHGPLCVVFPEGTFAPAGVELFPTQLAEAGLLVLLCGALYLLQRKYSGRLCLVWYAGLYGVIRFCLEFLRGDAERGVFLGLATSQWISLGLIVFAAAALILHHRKQSRERAAGKDGSVT